MENTYENLATIDPKQHPFQYGLNALSGIIENTATPNNPSVAGQALMGIAQGNQGLQQQQTAQGRQKFLQGLQQIIKSPKTPDEKANDAMGLVAQHGTDYGLGIKEVIDQYGKMSQRNALMQVYGQDEAGNLVPKSIIPKGSRIVQEKANPQEISAIGDAIVNGTQPPDLSRMYGKAGAVRAYLANQGFDLTKATRDYTATNTFVKNLNSTQQVRLNQVIDSVSQGIPALRDLSGELQRSDFNPSNFIIVKGEQNGIQLDPRKMGKLNPDQRQVAVKYLTQINLLRDEGAQVFSGGYAPTEASFKLVDDILNPYYSDPSTNAALDQLDYNLRIRKNAINNARPNSVGGQVNVPGVGAPQNPEVMSQGQGKQLDQNTAMQLLKQSGGDKNRARAMAKQMGYSF